MKRFLSEAEAKVLEAQASASLTEEDQVVDDLEAGETPESIMLSLAGGNLYRERTDKERVTPWLKFLWEAYRTGLDTLRNNARLEVLYQAFLFFADAPRFVQTAHKR